MFSPSVSLDFVTEGPVADDVVEPLLLLLLLVVLRPYEMGSKSSSSSSSEDADAEQTKGGALEVCCWL